MLLPNHSVKSRSLLVAACSCHLIVADVAICCDRTPSSSSSRAVQFAIERPRPLLGGPADMRELVFLSIAAVFPRYYPWTCVCLSVCVRVCLSQVGVLLKRQNRGSQNNTTRWHRESSFLMLKISAKFDRGHPLRGRRMQVRWVKIGDFRQITGYISKTVKDRHIVSIKVE